jgi:predicted  nucleic acid-binding Zn-ribbon protein
MSMTQIESNVERIQTRIDMIRQESRTLSFRIERMMEQRKNLTQEKKNLKDLLKVLYKDVSTTEQTEEVEE